MRATHTIGEIQEHGGLRLDAASKAQPELPAAAPALSPRPPPGPPPPHLLEQAVSKASSSSQTQVGLPAPRTAVKVPAIAKPGEIQSSPVPLQQTAAASPRRETSEVDRELEENFNSGVETRYFPSGWKAGPAGGSSG